MGRVLPYEKWNPASENASDFLPSYSGEDEKPLYLTSTGFVGPGSSAYYPESCSVSGSWDHFADVPAVYNALNGPTLPPIQFKASYQVIGWVNESGQDLLSSLAGDATASYNRYVGQCKDQSVAVSRTPAAEFVSLAKRRLY